MTKCPTNNVASIFKRKIVFKNVLGGPLRAIEEVSADILKLEELSDGLIREILNL